MELKKLAVVFGMIAIGVVGCKKEDLNQITTSTSQSDIQALAVQAETENSNKEVLLIDATGNMEAVNAGIAYDYLVAKEDLTADERSSNAGVKARGPIREKSFIGCLRRLDLDSNQVGQIKTALANYADCKSSAISRARAIHQSLVDKYKALAQAQVQLYKDSTITKAELDQRLMRLRKAFAADLRDLELKEKIGDALKNCHLAFLKELKGILTERQWKAFVACHRKLD